MGAAIRARLTRRPIPPWGLPETAHQPLARYFPSGRSHNSLAETLGDVVVIRMGALLAGLLLLSDSALPAQVPAERDWAAALRGDAQALHDDIAANHPGPVNPEDPGFAARNDAQLARALERARDAHTYGDYFFALRQYVAAFDDGHMGFGASGDTPNDFRWPGFVTDYDGRGGIRVVDRAEDSPVPVGARLLGCDGMTADQYAAATLGAMWGRWQLESQHRTWGRLLFLDESSRYIPHAASCAFEVDGTPSTIPLTWRPMVAGEVSRLMQGGRQVQRSFETRTLADGTRWYSIPSFSADPQSPAGQALPAIIAAMRAERAALGRVPAIVLDLRGNGGGSSDWSRQIAEVLWGERALAGLPSAEIHVDWRVSSANLASIERSFAQQNSGQGLSPHMRHWFETVTQGLRAALARGDELWREPDEEAEAGSVPSASAQSASAPLAAPVFFITDASCGSACLDAVDLWRALGAVHVGRTTSADTLYMDVRQLRLPSGIAAASVPMKVYRGRPRGANEPVVPVHVFDGDIGDTAALEQWIARLRTTEGEQERDQRLIGHAPHHPDLLRTEPVPVQTGDQQSNR